MSDPGIPPASVAGDIVGRDVTTPGQIAEGASAQETGSVARESGTDGLEWLKDRRDPRVRRFLDLENRRTEAALRDTTGLQAQLFQEFRALTCEDDRSAPARIDEFFYFYRTRAGKPYRVWMRTRTRPDAEEETLLDENALAEGHDFFQSSGIAVSPDHRFLALGYDVSGDEIHTVVVKDLETGAFVSDRLEGTSGAFAWAEDSRTLLYATRDETNRAYRVYRHRLGTDSKADPLVHEESDPAFHLSLRKTRSRRFILIELASAVTSETWVIDAHRPGEPPRRFLPRVRGVEYDVADAGDALLVRTNEGAKNFRLMRVPTEGEGWAPPEVWTEILPHRPDVMLTGVEAFRDFIVLIEREGGLPRIRIWLHGRTPEAVPMAEPVYVLHVGENPEFETDRFRYEFSSPVTPPTVFDVNTRTGESVMIKRQELPDFEPTRYRSRRIFATADDGIDIPISLVYRNGLTRDGSNPCLLMGYGAYGISYEPGFSSRVPSLLDRGFVYAVAHVRGGGEMGEDWHDQGKMLSKKTTFTDFIRCAETLIEDGYTCSELLGIQGRSAGGLLMGAVTNMRPDLFKTVIAGVPFVDVLSTMQDPTIPLTVIEYEEWGDPGDSRYFEYIRSYSPFDNVQKADYPHVLATAGLNDPRVQYWEPARWVARLRARRTNDRLLLLKTDLGAGHAGPSNRYELLREHAFEYAFLIQTLAPSLVSPD